MAWGGLGKWPSFPSRSRSHCHRRPSASIPPIDLGFQEGPWRGWRHRRDHERRGLGMQRDEGEIVGEGERERRPHQSHHRRLVPARANATLSSRPLLFCLARTGVRRLFLSLSERGTSESFEGGRTQERPSLELHPLFTPEFHRHPNTGILSTKYQMDDSKPKFQHPNRPLVISSPG
jgi:hypothetical protein